MQLLKLKSFRWFLRLLFLAWSLCVIMSLTACNPVAFFNPKSYGDKWSNTNMWFKPSDLKHIYVGGKNISEARKVPNGKDYLVIWKRDSVESTLIVESYVEEIDFGWFSGFDAADHEEEIPWTHIPNGLELITDRIKPPDSSGFYELTLSNDLKD